LLPAAGEYLQTVKFLKQFRRPALFARQAFTLRTMDLSLDAVFVECVEELGSGVAQV
jgi:hypothetical protein